MKLDLSQSNLHYINFRINIFFLSIVFVTYNSRVKLLKTMAYLPRSK